MLLFNKILFNDKKINALIYLNAHEVHTKNSGGS